MHPGLQPALPQYKAPQRQRHGAPYYAKEKARHLRRCRAGRTGGTRSARPEAAQARVRAIERIAGETIRAVRAMRTEAEVVAWLMVGAVSALTMLFMGFSLRVSSHGCAKRAPHASVFVDLLVRAARVGDGIKKGG